MPKLIANRTPLATFTSLALLTFVSATSLHAQTAPTPIIDNDRVKVWNITIAPNQSTPIPHDLDFVTVYLTGGDYGTISADGTKSVSNHPAGDAVFSKANTVQREETLSQNPAHLVVIELKDHPSPTFENTTGLPPAFPRPGAKKIVENDRVIAWNYSWTSTPTPKHFHDKDAVAIFRQQGSVVSTTPDGKATTTDYAFGEVHFSPGGPIHFEALAKGQQSAIIVQLK